MNTMNGAQNLKTNNPDEAGLNYKYYLAAGLNDAGEKAERLLH